MLRATSASTGAGGTRTKPSVARPSVMLCATVKAVMALSRRLNPATIHSTPKTNNRWSMPDRIWSTPSRK